MMDRFLKRLSKKAKKGMRGWPVATIAYYGPDASRATKVVVSIIPAEHLEPSEMRDWQTVHGDGLCPGRWCSSTGMIRGRSGSDCQVAGMAFVPTVGSLQR